MITKHDKMLFDKYMSLTSDYETKARFALCYSTGTPSRKQYERECREISKKLDVLNSQISMLWAATMAKKVK
jgi:hypothetical protein